MKYIPPLVSIMIPTYNRVGRLRRAVESALNQSYPRIEILVSDNASEDGTDDYLKSIGDQGIRAYRQAENIGLIANWNFLLKRASGDYCLMLSDDDELHDRAIATLIACLEEGDRSASNGEIKVAIGNSSISKQLNGGDHHSTQVLTCCELIQRVLRDDIQVLPSATLLNTELIKSKGYREYYGTAIDLGLLVDLQNSKAIVTSQVVCEYNIHADNITAKFDIDEVYKTYRRLLRAAYGCGRIGVDYQDSLNIFLRKMLSYVVAERYARNKISMLSALRYLRKYHQYFELGDYVSILFKMIAKKHLLR